MRNIGRGIFGLLSLFISGSGLMFMLAPQRAAAKLLISPEGIEGLSNFRAFVGASVLSIGISLMIAAVTAKVDNARPAALFVLGLLFARMLSLAVDGPNPAIGLYMAIPGTVFVLLVAAHKLIDMGDEAQTSKAPVTA